MYEVSRSSFLLKRLMVVLESGYNAAALPRGLQAARKRSLHLTSTSSTVVPLSLTTTVAARTTATKTATATATATEITTRHHQQRFLPSLLYRATTTATTPTCYCRQPVRFMAGHSKWANIKHAKGAADAKRAKLFLKLYRAIVAACRMGGADPKSNPRLATALSQAKAQSMPKETVQAAIKKGSTPGSSEEITFELSFPGAVHAMVETAGESRTASLSEIKRILNKAVGQVGKEGSAAWAFSQQGVVEIEAQELHAKQLDGEELALELDAEDIEWDSTDSTAPDTDTAHSPETGTTIRLLCRPLDLRRLQAAVQALDLAVLHATIEYRPTTFATANADERAETSRLLERIEALDFVERITVNLPVERGVEEEEEMD